jgi:hypothetical protein
MTLISFRNLVYAFPMDSNSFDNLPLLMSFNAILVWCSVVYSSMSSLEVNKIVPVSGEMMMLCRSNAWSDVGIHVW